jgi:nucleoside-diphosphate-sugar epimerase
VSECIQGDLSNREDIAAAAHGMNVIVHLGAFPNIIGVYQLCDVARELEVARLVLGSSVRAVSGLPFDVDGLS